MVMQSENDSSGNLLDYESWMTAMRARVTQRPRLRVAQGSNVRLEGFIALAMSGYLVMSFW
jgi:hypothetical protein